MRVLILSQFFDPEPTLKGLAFAKELQRQGCEVEVLTGFPNYPGGRLYPGYRIRPWRRETLDGIRVTRVALYPSHDRSAVRRVANYVSFAVMAAVAGPWLVRKPDVMYVHHPPPTISWPARVLRAVTGAPFVYEIQDMWPDTLGATGMLSGSAVLRVIGAWCRRVYRAADRIVVISPGFSRLLSERGVPADRVDVLYNWAEEGRLVPGPRDETLARSLRVDERFTVMFAGTMGLAQDLGPVLDAAAQCRDRLPAAQFVFVGGGVERERLEREAAARGLDNVHFLPRQPMERMGSILSLADALLVHLKDDPLFAITVPSKTQAYLYAGRPVIMAVRGDGAELVRRSAGGVVCEPGNARSIADAVVELAALTPAERRAMGERGRAFYDAELSLHTGATRYGAILRRTIADAAKVSR